MAYTKKYNQNLSWGTIWITYPEAQPKLAQFPGSSYKCEYE